nr:eukaryotic peptide chain release factor GTP-binding subunit ERF3A isoform X1 [Tanacetum cinerariifolium]
KDLPNPLRLGYTNLVLAIAGNDHTRASDGLTLTFNLTVFVISKHEYTYTKHKVLWIHGNKLAEMPFIGTLIGFLKFGAKFRCVDACMKGTSSSAIDVEADIKTNQHLVVLGGSGFLGLPICKVVAANHFMIICQEVADVEALLNITNGDFYQGAKLGIMSFEVNQQKVIVHRKHSRLTEKARTKQCLFDALDGIEVDSLDPNGLFRYHIPIMDKIKELGTVLMGKVESGSVHEDDSLLVMPNKKPQYPYEPLEQDIAICSDKDDPMKQGHKEEELRNAGWMLCQKVLTLRIMFLLLRPRLKSKYATGGHTNVLVYVTRVVKVDNDKVPLLEGDSVESEKKYATSLYSKEIIFPSPNRPMPVSQAETSILPVRIRIRTNIGSDDGVTTSFQRSRNSRTPCSIIKDKYMMKAQVHVLKSSAISDVQALPRRKYFYYQVVKKVLRGRLLASFQDLEHQGGDTRIARWHEIQG